MHVELVLICATSKLAQRASNSAKSSVYFTGQLQKPRSWASMAREYVALFDVDKARAVVDVFL